MTMYFWLYEDLDNNVYLMIRINNFTIYKTVTILNNALVFNCNIVNFFI